MTADSAQLRERYGVLPLAKRHDRSAFSCSVDALDDYLRRQRRQDARRWVAMPYVAEERDTAAVHGYYTLSTASVLLDLLPEELASKMPRYGAVPSVRLGRLAVHRDAQGLGLGSFLLMDAMARSVRIQVGWAAFLVDAKDTSAREFYRRFGFQSLDDDPNHLFLMRKTIEPLFMSEKMK